MVTVWKSNLPKRHSFFVSIVGLITLFFILIINFTISNSVVFWSGIPVETVATNHPERCTASKIIVTLTQDGKLFFNDREMTWESLEKELSDKVHDLSKADKRNYESPVPMIVIRADKNTRLTDLTKLTDLCRGQNINICLASDQIPQQTLPGFAPATK